MEETDKYQVEADGVKVDVTIKKGKGVITVYNIDVPDLSKPTLALVDEIRHQLITEVKVSATEILDPKIMVRLKQRFNIE